MFVYRFLCFAFTPLHIILSSHSSSLESVLCSTYPADFRNTNTCLHIPTIKMSDEPIPKADKDFTSEVDKVLPEAEELAQVWIRY